LFFEVWTINSNASLDSARRPHSGGRQSHHPTRQPRILFTEVSKKARAQKKGRKRKERPTVEVPEALSKIAKASNIEGFVARSIEERKEDTNKKDKVARPLNAFMLYQLAYTAHIKEYVHDESVVSEVAGKSWQKETQEVKDKYKNLARWEKIHHLEAHPGYGYKPKNRADESCNTPGSCPPHRSLTLLDRADHGLPIIESAPSPAIQPPCPSALLTHQRESDMLLESTLLAAVPGADHYGIIQPETIQSISPVSVDHDMFWAYDMRIPNGQGNERDVGESW
jgi:hypothetical protein